MQKGNGIHSRSVGIATALGLIIVLGAALRFYELGKYSIGNTYYAATVQSMLASWHNFVFAAFEPGGSVTVDKPPLGFWVQAASASLFGMNGFALALPNALSGVLSLPLLYSLVKKQFGTGAGLIAALVLAVTPVTVSTERNNTIDGLLVFVLLLAAWAVWESVSRGKARYLLLGAVLVGLGFNIKMLQAFMALPALYALYLIGAPHRWLARFVHLGSATLILLVVSLAWVVAVDMTPEEQRPYIGSSTNNTMMELIIGHNGLSRLGLNRLLASNQSGRDADGGPGTAGGVPQAPPFVPPGTPVNTGTMEAPPQWDGGMNNREVGQAGPARLFSEPLVSEAGWLLPLALFGMTLTAVQLVWKRPLNEKNLALILWGSWLLPAIAYFSFTTGLFHAYYLIMLGPPLAALTGITFWTLWRTMQRRPWVGWTLVLLLSGVTLVFQAFTLGKYPEIGAWVVIFSAVLWTAGVGSLALNKDTRPGAAALTLVATSLLLAPLVWSGLTAANTISDAWLPRSGPGATSGSIRNNLGELSDEEAAFLDFLLENTGEDGYLLATPNARQAAPYILATGRPVLTFGGFIGRDEIIDAQGLAQMVTAGKLRFVLANPELARSKPEIASWVVTHCLLVDFPGASSTGANTQRSTGQGGRDQPTQLYDCVKTIDEAVLGSP